MIGRKSQSPNQSQNQSSHPHSFATGPKLKSKRKVSTPVYDLLPHMFLRRSSTSTALAGGPSSVLRTSSRFFSAAANKDLKDYDVVVIGGGPGGYVGAIKAAQLGLKTACVESRGALGGTCLNVGCIPSKALLHASHLYHQATHDFSKFGIEVENVTLDFGKMMKTKNTTVSTLTKGIEGLFKKNKVDYVEGYGKIVGANQVSVALNDGTNTTLEAKNIVIATGSEVSPLSPCPVDNSLGRIVDSTGALTLKSVPKHLVVIGGGVIGLEMGSVYQRLGAKVTVVEYMDRLCPGLDKQLSKEFQKLLKKQGFHFEFKTAVTGSKVTKDGVTLTVEPASGKSKETSTIDCDVVLVATGRRPFTQGLGLEEMGIQLDKMGRVEVNDQFQTPTISSIYAIGDVIQGPMLAHKAEEDGVACMENIAGLRGHVNYNNVPGVIYTHPEVASVGQTEEQLKEANVAYNVGSFPMMANSRARAVGDSDGFVKVLADKTTDRILGVHIIGANAGEMIHEGCIGMEYGAASEDLARTCHAHPTLSEAFKEACLGAHGKTINF